MVTKTLVAPLILFVLTITFSVPDSIGSIKDVELKEPGLDSINFPKLS
jgi:hypothetical protein